MLPERTQSVLDDLKKIIKEMEEDEYTDTFSVEEELSEFLFQLRMAQIHGP